MPMDEQTLTQHFNSPIVRGSLHDGEPSESRRGVAQPGRALLSGGRSRRFESSHPDQLAPVQRAAANQAADAPIELMKLVVSPRSMLVPSDSIDALSAARAAALCGFAD
jgi:hypothetical protein